MTKIVEATGPTSAPDTASPPRDASLLVQLHLAEYQALTTRNTYWITLQYGVWPILLLVLTLVAQVRTSFNPELLVWGAALIIQGGVLAYYASLYEIYNNIRYIETALRPLVEALVSSRRFWGYEPYVSRHRALSPSWWENWPAALAGATVVFGLWGRAGSWHTGDTCGLVLNVALVFIIARMAQIVRRTRKEFFAPSASGHAA